MANTSMVVTFLSQDTQKPLPTGLTVSIYAQGVPQVPANVIATGTLDSSGSASLSLAFNTGYTAIFTGTGAPTYQYNFTLGSGQFVVGPFATVSDQQNAPNGFLGILNTGIGTPAKTMFQWGTTSVSIGTDGTGTQAVSFPEAFPNALVLCDPVAYDGATDNGYFSKAKSINESLTGTTIHVESAPPNSTVTVRFFAIGY